MLPLLDLMPSSEMQYVVVFSVRDGLIAELDVFYKNPSAVTPLLTG